MAQAVADHAADAWWEEVFLLAIAYPGHYDEQREYLLECLRKAGHLVLAGHGAVDAGARLPVPLRETIKAELYARMTDANFAPTERQAAGEAWDELGGLPEDLDAWVLCRDCADDGGDLLASKYPITNAQFERFIHDGGYLNPKWWGGEESPGWRWRTVEYPSYRGKKEVTQPGYWNHPRVGKDRRGYPVVGVSWYEAAAYAAWLTEWLKVEGHKLKVWRNGQLSTLSLQPGTFAPRLPAETEWLRLARGEKGGERDRYPWDVPGSGRVTEYESEKGRKAILARANTSESGLGGTSPVAMYPLGARQPHGLWDLAGNVWEWASSRYDQDKSGRVLRGGSWNYDLVFARPSVRLGSGPDFSFRNYGFRVVSPISSDF